MATRTIEVTKKEEFAFNFISNHNGKGIPTPLPLPVMGLIKKGLVRTSYRICPSSYKTKCFLTSLGRRVVA